MANNLLTGLISHWELEEASGNVIDSKGSNDGTVNGATYGATGKILDCLDFDGTNDTVTFGNIPAIDTATEISVSLWVNLDVDAGHDQYMVENANNFASGFIFYVDDVSSATARTNVFRVLMFDADDADSQFLETPSNAINPTNWQHLVCTIDLGSATGLRMYLDGVEVADSPKSISNITSLDDASNSFSFATHLAGASARYLDGRMDEVSVFNKILSQTDVDTLYNSGSGLAFSSFDDGVPATDHASQSVTAGGDLTDFSLLVDLSTMPSEWWTAVDTTDGTRGRVFKEDLTALAVDWIDFNDTAETGWARVKWSGTLSSSVANSIRIYPPVLANVSVAVGDTFGAYGAYDSNWLAYWANAGTVDRTGNQIDGIAQGSPTIGGATGKVGKGTDFNGSTQYIDAIASGTDVLVGLSAFSVYGWGELDALTADGRMLSRWGATQFALWMDTGGSGDGWAFRVLGSTGDISIGENNSDATTSFQHIRGVYDGSGSEIFVDASSTATGAAVGTVDADTASPTQIGKLLSGFFDGVLNEIQMHSVARSDNWGTEEYSQSNNNVTYWGTWTWSGTPTGIVRRNRMMLGVGV